MSARSGLVGEKSSWPYLGPSEATFCIGQGKKCTNFAYFPWWANGPLFTRCGPLLLSTRSGAIGMLHFFLDACTSFSPGSYLPFFRDATGADTGRRTLRCNLIPLSHCALLEYRGLRVAPCHAMVPRAMPYFGMFVTEQISKTWTFFQNLKFPTCHVPSIQIELILS